MNLPELTQPNLRILDARVAEEIMGWRRIERDVGPSPEEPDWVEVWFDDKTCEDYHGLFEPSSDLNDCHLMESRLAEMGLEGVYYGNLLGMISEVFKGRYLEFGIVHADPLQKVQAALRTVEMKRTKPTTNETKGDRGNEAV